MGETRGGNKAVRMFRCAECNHRMRFWGSRCGYCHAHKPLLQKPTPLILLSVPAALGIMLAMLAMLAVFMR
jgi:hypothetical protein